MHPLLIITCTFLLFAVFFAVVAVGVLITSKPQQAWARIMVTVFAGTSCLMVVVVGTANQIYKAEYQAEVTVRKVRSQ